MQTKTLLSEYFFELLNRYPSPHNGQPIVLKQVDATHFELYFETKRGLQAAEVSYLFSFVTMGLFVTYLTMCAEAFGYGCEYVAELPKLAQLKSEGIARCAVRPDYCRCRAAQYAASKNESDRYASGNLAQSAGCV